jgi:hypothetical protein
MFGDMVLRVRSRDVRGEIRRGEATGGGERARDDSGMS